MKPIFVRFVITSLVCFFGPSAAAGAAPGGSDWPQWRGPGSQGISAEAGLPTEWSDTKNVQWKTPIPGAGHSSPIVSGGRVFLTTSVEGAAVERTHTVTHLYNNQVFKHPDWTGADRMYTLKVLCLDRKTGRVLWERVAYEGKVYDTRHRKNTYASSTPATDGRYVYAYFGPEGLYCYDFDGNQVWKASLGQIGSMGMGVGTSPVLYENLLILQCDQEYDGGASFLLALDKKTGKQVWKTARSNRASWSTPVIARHGRRVELITSGGKGIISYDPATGKELWRCQGVEDIAIPTPVVGPGLVIVSGGGDFKCVVAVRTGGSGDVTGTPNVLWKFKKSVAYVASPILYGDFFYLMSDKGILTCMDAKTGELKYEGGRVPVPATFMSSPVAFDGKLLLTSEDGETFVIKAGPTFEVLGTNSIGEPVYASVAISDGNIFIRGAKHLYCIGSASGGSHP
jgi:outer membrane protein assembly factor BamB